MRTSSERGIALIMTLVVLILLSALMVGFTAVVMSDQRFRGIDRDRQKAFYAAHSGLEKLTADLGGLFNLSLAPSAAQLTAIQAAPPAIPGITFQAADGSSGYLLTAQAASSGIITSGSPYAGLRALKTIYDMESTARSVVGGEVHLSRRLETVAIPVFQFGIFSTVDQSFFAGPSFSFGGRVHTNGNLFLAQGGGATLTLNDRVTAVREVVRERLSNGVSIDGGHTGTVSILTAGAPRDLLRTEGSVVDDENSSQNGLWQGISENDYSYRIRNGVRPLNLPHLSTGRADLVRRPVANEHLTDPTLLAARFFSKVSLRILLSDTAADIMSLPGVTPDQPVLLDGNWNLNPPAGYGVPTSARPPIALSAGPQSAVTTGNTPEDADDINVGTIPSFVTLPYSFTFDGIVITCTTMRVNPAKLTGCSDHPEIPGKTVLFSNGVTSTAGIGLVGGYIKIETQNNAKVWRDVTMEFLRLGISGPNLSDATSICLRSDPQCHHPPAAAPRQHEPL